MMNFAINNGTHSGLPEPHRFLAVPVEVGFKIFDWMGLRRRWRAVHSSVLVELIIIVVTFGVLPTRKSVSDMALKVALLLICRAIANLVSILHRWNVSTGVQCATGL